MKRIVGHDSLPEKELRICHFPDESDDRGRIQTYGGPRCLEDLKGEGTSLACHGLSHSFLFRYNTPGIARPIFRIWFHHAPSLHPYVSGPAEITRVSSAAWWLLFYSQRAKLCGSVGRHLSHWRLLVPFIFFFCTLSWQWFCLYYWLGIKPLYEELHGLDAFSNQEQHIITNFLRGPENAPNPSIYIYIIYIYTRIISYYRNSGPDTLQQQRHGFQFHDSALWFDNVNAIWSWLASKIFGLCIYVFRWKTKDSTTNNHKIEATQITRITLI